MITLSRARRHLALCLIVSALPAIFTAAGASYNLQLNTPKLQSLTTSLATTGGVASVQVQAKYDEKGTITCTSTMDGAAATCKGTIKTSVTGTSYQFKLSGATV